MNVLSRAVLHILFCFFFFSVFFFFSLDRERCMGILPGPQLEY